MSIEFSSNGYDRSWLPEIVLVHGALTDASVRNAVAERLQSERFTTISPALPLRGPGPVCGLSVCVFRNAHSPIRSGDRSYGGSIISHPALATDAFKALAFVAAFAPDTGGSTADLEWLAGRVAS